MQMLSFGGNKSFLFMFFTVFSTYYFYLRNVNQKEAVNLII